jgi:ABC-type Mn2+/Zn2+ transport system permease subunit
MFWAMVATLALGLACSVMSIVVILRGWSFLGEGISHAGFGGVGTAFVLSLLVPGLRDSQPAFAVAAVFCLVTAMAIARLSRGSIAPSGSSAAGGSIGSDAAIGVFVAASLAWGFVAFQWYAQGSGKGVASWELYLFGSVDDVTRVDALASVCVSAAVMLIVALLGRQVLLYCLDPTMAQVSGVAVGMIHYLLFGLLALVVIATMWLVGNLLAPALLVLPGATALSLSRRLKTVMLLSTGAGGGSVLAGMLIHGHWTFLPPGPAIVLVNFLLLLAARAWVAILTRRGAGAIGSVS